MSEMEAQNIFFWLKRQGNTEGVRLQEKKLLG